MVEVAILEAALPQALAEQGFPLGVRWIKVVQVCGESRGEQSNLARRER